MITYKEFKRQVKAINSDLKVNLKGCFGEVEVNYARDCIAVVNRRRIYDMNTSNMGNKMPPQEKMLFDLVTELAATPLDKRKEPKKYYYFLPKLGREIKFLHINTKKGAIFYSGEVSNGERTNHFTENQFVAISKVFGIKEGSHERKEVTDDEH